MKYLISISLTISILFSSCKSGQVPFTSSLKQSYNLNEKTLKKLQFYTSEEIVLFEVKEESDASVSDGKLFVSNQKNFEKITILKQTPCVLEKVIDDNKMVFSFETGEGRFLAFGTENNGAYSLLAKEWEGNKGTLRYSNKMYSTENGDVYLNVVLKKLNKLKSRERVVRGKRL